ncbi:MAG: shikimate kinase, partial [Pararhodobacter sp.]
LMRERAISVWLNADLETLWRRVQKRDNRPLLKRADAKLHLTNLVAEREPFYSQADLTVHSKDGPHAQTVNAILKALQTWNPQ